MKDLIPKPLGKLRNLDKLVGEWKVEGLDNAGVKFTGTEIYEWLEGGFFMKQVVNQWYAGQHISGIQIIGYERKWGEEFPGEECTSHFFDNMGNAWEYVWEIEDRQLIIWGGYKGSPAVFKGDFTSDGNMLKGRWVWPGGGYESITTRIDHSI